MNENIFRKGDLVVYTAANSFRASGSVGIVRCMAYTAFEPKYSRYEIIWTDGVVSNEEAWRLRCEARLSTASDGPMMRPSSDPMVSDTGQGRATGAANQSATKPFGYKQGRKE